ncbi:MAG: G-D-S-L family lipolytic protein [Cyanothece sp. SIO1E1]|nr:G-D-S-L family lipolytic protein [Cyanothece sp. SIO1E1]
MSASNHSQADSAWTLLSLVTGGILLLATLFLLREQSPFVAFKANVTAPAAAAPQAVLQADELLIEPVIPDQLGPRHKLTYEQWVTLLRQEAKVAAAQQPDSLTVLVGDSISLWFPPHLLPHQNVWLNQGISGETSAGLLKRLNLLDQTQPKAIFVMIGINDLIRGWEDTIILANYRRILRYLGRAHPQAKIVAQSILPHSDEQASWEGRERLVALPNSRIKKLNQAISAIALETGAYYLDLYPLLTDLQGNLRADLTTDGLHLNPQGYLVWSAAMQLFSQIELELTLGQIDDGQ